MTQRRIVVALLQFAFETKLILFSDDEVVSDKIRKQETVKGKREIERETERERERESERERER